MPSQWHCEVCGGGGRLQSCRQHPQAPVVRFPGRVEAAYQLLQRLDGHVDFDEIMETPGRHPDTAQFSPQELAQALYWARLWERIRELPVLGEPNGLQPTGGRNG